MTSKYYLVFALVFLATCKTTWGQVLKFGSCPTQPTVVSNFDITQEIDIRALASRSNHYVGKWYENRKYFFIFEFGQKCITATYTDNSDGSVTVLNEAKGVLFNDYQKITGKATQSSPGKLIVSFGFGSTTTPNYWVLGTDYTSYAVVWSCSSYGFLNSQIAWILTRDQVPSSTVIDTALGVLTSNGIKTAYLKITDQKNC